MGEQVSSTHQAKQYARTKRVIFLCEILLTFGFLVVTLLFGVSRFVREIAQSWTASPALGLAAFLALYGALFYLVGLPLSFYGDFYLEHRFGLSTQKFRSWVWEEVKGILVSSVIGLVLLEGLYLLLGSFPMGWWFWAALGWIAFTFLLGKFAPVLLLPLFFKTVPLQDAALRDRLLRLAERVGAKVQGVFTINLSKKTKKANAALTGFGGTRRIIVADTLLADYTPDEVEMVLAHELGHHALAHLWKLLVFSSAASFTGLYLAARILEQGASALGLGGGADWAAFPLLCLVLFGFGLVMMPLQNGFSRKLERDADIFALETVHAPQTFIDLMRKLGEKNLADVSPPAWVEWLLYDHPSISKRVALGEEFQAGRAL